MALYFGRNKIGKIKTGVAGKTEDLTTVLNEQEALITELETVLAGKAAGGGGSVETCTVNVNIIGSPGYVNFIMYETPDGVYVDTAQHADQSYTIQNIICGTIAVFCYSPMFTCNVTTENVDLQSDRIANYLWCYPIVFRASQTSGGIGTLTITDKD